MGGLKGQLRQISLAIQLDFPIWLVGQQRILESMTEFYIALLLVAASHAFQVGIGLDLADEGSLWNGVLRIARGKVPIRDFRAYDPGRYYWSWAWMQVFGHGILGLRHSVATFNFLGLWAGLVAVGSATDSEWQLAAAGVICVLWMHPRHKLFEHALSLIAICTLVFIIQHPSPAMLFAAGVFTGLAAFMGRNHGAWTFAAIVSLLVVLWFRGEVDNAAWLTSSFFAGVVTGYAPMLIMWAIMPDMFRRFWYNQIIVYLFVKRGRGGMPLPIPWPWKDKYRQPRLRDRASRLFIGLHFVALPVFYASAFAWIVFAPAAMENPLLVASCLVGVFYAHHAVRRSDLPHLCQVIQPFLLGLYSVIFSLQNSWLSTVLVAVLAVIGYFTTRQINPLIRKLESPDQYTRYDVNGDKLWVPKTQAQLLTRVRELVAENLRPGDSIFIAPITPALYPILQVQTPLRSDFLLHRETEQVQKEAIQELESNHVNWALIQDLPLDGRDDLRFQNSHAVMWDYFCAHFTAYETGGLGSDWQFLKRRDELRNDVTQEP